MIGPDTNVNPIDPTVADSSALQSRRTSFSNRTEGDAIVRDIDASLKELRAARVRFVRLENRNRIELAEACLQGVLRCSGDWVDASCRAKGIPADSVQASEEILAGPLAVVRYLQLLIRTLWDLETWGKPRLPGRPKTMHDGSLRIPVFPVKGFWDPAVLRGLRVHVRMQPEVTRQNLDDHLAAELNRTVGHPARLCVVLGAGNVSAIPALDALYKLFHENTLVLLKLNPVNDYLGPILEQAFAPLIRDGYWRLLYGDAEVGAQAIAHPLVDTVHVTGSSETHDAIVWGPAGMQREARLRNDLRLLTKPITSELGNVSPWLIVPAEYSQRQLRFQAQSLAASVMNNGGFNCVGTRVLVTSRRWAQRERFLNMLEELFARTPPRVAYYPGAFERFRNATGIPIDSETGQMTRLRVPEPNTLVSKCTQESNELVTSRTLPWTLLRDIDPDGSGHLLSEECFVCVVAEVCLDAEDPQSFLNEAVDFVNERLWGTLSAALTVPERFRRWLQQRRVLDDAVRRLHYGMIGINHWPGLLFALASPPWGAAPGSSLQDIQSGRGWVHNSFMLDGIQQTILDGPLTLFPTPIWFPSRRDARTLAWETLKLYERPTLSRLVSLSWHALKGETLCGT